MTSTQHSAPRLTNGHSDRRDSYAISMRVPGTYFSEVERTVYRNISGMSAADALAKIPVEDQARVVAVWPERF